MESIVFLRAKPSIGRAGLAGWLTHEFGPSVLSKFPGISSCDVEVAVLKPEAFIVPPDMELKSADAPSPPYDGALILSGEPSAVSSLLAGDLADQLDLLHAYQASGTVEIDKGFRPGRPTPGIKFLLSLRFFPDLSPTAARRCWANHAPLARRVHIGANRYVQWWVEGTLTRDAPPLNGIVELHFPTEADLVDRFFDSPRGEEEIVQDTADFICGGHPRVFLHEYAFRRG